MLGKQEMGSMEVRFNGDCPWCDSPSVSLRDYMCYDPIKPCCYEMYRKLQPKVFAAVRCFPNRTVDVGTQFDELVDRFYNCTVEDRRFMKENEEVIDRIDETLQQYDSDLKEFLQFLARLYLARGVLKLKGDDEFRTLYCLVCARELSDTYRREICPTCMEAIGSPPDKVEKGAPAQSAPQTQRMGMHVRKR